MQNMQAMQNFNMQQNQEDMEIDLLALLKAYWAHKWIILLITLLIGGLAFGYTNFFVDPTYEAASMLYVNNRSTSNSASGYVSTTDISAAKSLVSTYSVIIKTDSTLDKVISAVGSRRTSAQLKKMITVKAVDGTEIFAISVKSTNPQEAAQLANAIASVIPDRISDVVSGANVKLVDSAKVPKVPVAPNKTKMTAIGAFIGFIIPCVFITLKELFDDTIHDDEYLVSTFGIPVLASIPNVYEK